jgi:hypothetical protein
MYKERSYYTFTEEEYDRFVKGEEVWKDVDGFNGVYQISTEGRVRSFKRNTPAFLKAWNKGRGYLAVDLNVNSVSKYMKVHQLSAIRFLGHVPCGMKLVVDHIDRDRSNNRLVNLRVTTNRKNCYFKNSMKTTSKYVGVCFDKSRNKWLSKIKFGDTQHNLGRFEIEEDASEAYQSALKVINETGFFNLAEWKASRKK